MKLTEREKEVIELLAEGYTTPEIGRMLYIGTETVRTHRRNLMMKLEAKNVANMIHKYHMQ